MCGLAGWNVSKQYADEHFTEKLVKDMCEVGFESNLHRGLDAAGWVASSYIDDKKAAQVQYWKSPGPATKSVMLSGPWPSERASSVLLHTRAKTAHDAKDNDNNHPVVDGNVLAVHNGNIRNHLMYRNRFKLGHKPPVDSWIIPAMFNKEIKKTPQELDLVEVVDMVSTFEGSYVFMVMWAKRPRHVLLVKGPERELWVAQNDHAIFWSSEPDGLYEMIDMLPDADTFKCGPLEDGQVLMLNNGRVLASRQYEVKKQYQHGNKMHPTLQRVHDNFEYILDQNDTKYHWTRDASPLSIYDADLSAENVILLDPTNKEDAERMPSSWPAGFYTADEIWVWTPPDNPTSIKHVDSRFYLIMNDVEIITTTGNSIKDVYDWTDIDPRERSSSLWWETVEPEEPEGFVFDDPKRFKVVQTFGFTDLGEIADGRRKKRLEKSQPSLPLGGGTKKDATTVDKSTKKKNPAGIFGIGGNGKSRVTVDMDERNGDWKVLIDGKPIVQHKDQFWFVFEQDRWCNDHQQWLKKHDDPAKCELAVLQVLETISNLVCVEDFEFVFGFEAIKYESSDYKKKNPMHVCKMEPVAYRYFTYNPGLGLRVKLPVRDKCRNNACSSSLVLDWSETEEPFKTLVRASRVGV